MPRRPDNTFERLCTKGVSGAFVTIRSLGATRSDGQVLLVDSLATVRPVTGARPVGDSVLMETVSKLEASEKESLDILGKVGQIAETWNQQREEITQATPSHKEGPTVKSRKVKIDTSFKMTR